MRNTYIQKGEWNTEEETKIGSYGEAREGGRDGDGKRNREMQR